MADNPFSDISLRCRIIIRTVAVVMLASGGVLYAAPADSADTPFPPVVRFVRIYGGTNELLPPVLLVRQRSASLPIFGEKTITVELDIQASIPPTFVATFVHCTADWREDGNGFLNDIAFMRTTNIQWTMSPAVSRYYSYRGVLSFPNETIRIPYGGNWKVQFRELGDTALYAEARFFALDYAMDCTVDVFNDFYEPVRRASPVALTLEATAGGNQGIADVQLHTAVFYRNHRWNEPFVASQSTGAFAGGGATGRRFGINPTVRGMASAGKRFRVEQLPAENDYRVLDMTQTGLFPRSTVPVRLPLSDLRRNGGFLLRADDGAMVTRGISMSDDDYIPVEFVLDPENRLPADDVFVIGSFNNWRTTAEWQMRYDEENRLYTLRQWIRRARHNYCYATGRENADTRIIENMSFEEFEGNNAGAGHTFIAFIYYRDPSFGGYDSIVGIGASSVFGQVRR
ncbi:MAG: hypothetical protein JNL32_00505 [Candidatus Kapabacteria bacterium]|nr:hypothetical protein [Candidatus Kapabacteria bacterium]